IESIVAVEEIDIFGKRAILHDINGVSTKPLDLSKVTETDTFELELDLPEGTIADDEFVEVKINVNKRKTFEDVTIETEAEDDVQFTITKPQNERVTIRAIGLDETINKLKKADIRAYIKLTNITTGTHQVNLTIEGPEGINYEPDIETVTIAVP